MGREGKGETLNPAIRKVRLGELEEFINSEIFAQLSHVPITWTRARSYLENPLGQPKDVALLLALLDDKLVAFRSLFAGQVHADGEDIRFGWCSGSWVHPDYRRKGISLHLLKEAYSDWNGRLMLTNYSPETENLFLKSNLFHEVYHYKGARAYLYPDKEKVKAALKRRLIGSFLYPIVIESLRILLQVRLSFFRETKSASRFEESEFPDAQCYQLMRKNEDRFLFSRDENVWKWIFRDPWISDENWTLKEKYPFTACSDDFYYRTIKVYKDSELTGFFIFSVRDKHLKFLFTCMKEQDEGEIVSFIKKYSVKNAIKTVTIYNSNVADCLLKNRKPFLLVRPYGQKIYGSFPIMNAGTWQYRDGEGDYVFT